MGSSFFERPFATAIRPSYGGIFEHEQVEMGGTRSVARGEVVDGEELSALGACQSNALRRRDESAHL